MFRGEIKNYQVKTKEQIEQKYQSWELVREYEKRRFHHPIWGMAHFKEVAIVNRFLKRIHPQKLLEIAPGTARISRNLKSAYFEKGYAIDASPQMLKVTRDMLSPVRWKVRLGDAFAMDFPENYFDVVMTFRFIRHFLLHDRKKIYAQVNRVLKPGGYLIFEAFHKNMEPIAYEKIGLGGAKGIYDELWTKAGLARELDEAGFELVILKRYLNQVGLCYFIDRFRALFFRLTKLEMLKFWRGVYRLIDLVPSSHNCYFEVLCRKK